MSRVKIDQRMYLTEDGARAVPEGDPDAHSLLCPAGGELDRAIAGRLGLLDASRAQEEGAATEEDPPKRRRSAPNKARRAAPNKSAGNGGADSESGAAGQGKDDSDGESADG